MRLYSYSTSLSSEEREAWEKYRSANQSHGFDVIQASTMRSSLFSQYRAIRHMESRWPDNYIDVDAIPARETLEQELLNYQQELDSAPDERPLQRHLTNHPYIIGALTVGTNSGHHANYVFPEFQLGNQLRPDFLVCGKNSQGYQWICVELQSPRGQILNRDGSEGSQAREGLQQIRAWRDWFRENLSYARNTLDLEGIHEGRTRYVLVIGTRNNYDVRTNQWRDRLIADNHWLDIISYDRLSGLFTQVIETRYF